MIDRKITLAALAAAGSLALGACGTGDSDSSSGSSSGTSAAGGAVTGGPGIDVAAKKIRIGDLTALSGPVAALGVPTLNGFKTALKAVNESGDLGGWKMTVTVKDTGYVPQNHVQAYNGVVKDIAVLESFGSPTTKAIQPLFDKEGILTVPLSFDSKWSEDATMAPVGVPYAIDIENGLHYLVTEKSAPKKVGIIYQDDEYGADGLRGYEAAVAADGLDDVARVTYKPGDTDFTAQVQKLKSAGAKLVVVTAVPSASAPFVGTAASLGYTPTYLFQGPAWLEQIFTKDGTLKGKPTPVAGALAKDTYVMGFAAPWGSDVPGMKQMIADQEKYAPKQIPSVYFTAGYAQGKVLAQILKKAIDSGDLSRAGILAAKQSVGTIDTGGLAAVPDYSTPGEPVSSKSIINKIDGKTDGFLDPVAAGVGG